MKRPKATVIGAALLVVGAAIAMLVFGLASRTGDGYGERTAWTDVTAKQLAEMLGGGDRYVVNVRVPYEGGIPGTDAFIPYDEIGVRLSELPSDPDAEIVLYCRSGRMSLEAARTLVAAGYTSVYNLVGGFDGWEAAGYALVRGEDARASP